jgi:hypothetical protein
LVNSFLRFVLVALAILPAGMPVDSQACNVPAFRYALERWPADPYQILVYHQSAPQGEAFELLRKGAAAKGGAANFSLKTVDVTQPEGKALAEQRKIATYPWAEVLYPAHSQVRAPVWSGPLTSDRVRRILNSPIRSRLAEKLLGGDVAVWVLIKSGHEPKDLRALASLKTHLERASATLRIPEIGTDLNGNPVEVADFKSYPVRFSLVEIAHDNPEEELLVNALLMSESDLEDSDEPVAFPVFGRGRALYALVGNGIEEKNIREACQSMLAWCSCEVKAQNPGTDLLIAADWSRPYGGKMVSDPELPLAGLSGFAQDQAAAQAEEKPAPKVDAQVPEAGRTPAPAVCSVAATARIEAPPARPSGDSPLMRNLLILAGAAGLALLGLSAIVAVKAKR